MFSTDVVADILSVSYYYNDFLVIVTILRLYVLLRAIIGFSDFYDERAGRVM